MSLLNKIKFNPKKLFGTLAVVSLMAIVTTGAVYDAGMKEITVVRIDAFANTSESFTTTTRQDDMIKFFEEKGILIADDEILNTDLSNKLEDGEVLEIRQGKPVTIVCDGYTKNVLTSKTNVAGALVENGVEIGDHDWSEPAFETPVTDGMKITLRRITVQEETVTETIACPEEIRTDDNMYVDEKNIQWGTEGEKKLVYRVLREGENEVYRELVGEEVIKEATTTVVTVGTKPNNVVTKGGRTFTYAKKFTARATAYDTSLEENGGYTKTAMGLTPGYGIVAVDPRVIPLGTKLYIESTDDGKSWSYGYCIAGDTGGAIKGDRIDLCYNTQYECRKFGRRNATVYIIEE